MLASPGYLPPAGSGFAYEFKWDGMRVLVRVEGDKVEAESRNGNDAAARFPELKGLPKALGKTAKAGVVLDGELVVLGKGGKPDFGLMQTRMAQSDATEIRRSMATHPVQFLAFDVLAIGTRDLVKDKVPYVERRKLLEGLGLSEAPFIVPPYQVGSPDVVLDASRELGLEGVVAKRLTSPYLPGERSPHWVKVRNRNRQEFVVGGWSEGEGARAGFVGSLVLGVYGSPLGGKKLHFVGRTGSGFRQADLERLKKELEERATDVDPFHPFEEDYGADPIRFVKPELVCEVEFSGLANNRVLRQAAFKGLRVDKPPREVVWEQTDVSPFDEGDAVPSKGKNVGRSAK